MQFRRKKTFIEKGMEYAEQALAATEAAIADAREKAGPVLSEARDTAIERAAEAREKAGPVVQDARDRAVLHAHDAREKAVPLMAEAKARAAEQASAGRDLAAAKVAQVKGEEPEPKGGFFKKLLILGGFAALGAVVFKKLQGSQESNWQSSYVPTPPAEPAGGPAPVTPAAPAAGATTDDVGGADPAESLSDTAEAPHDVTTPDNPVETVEVESTGDPLTDPLPPEER